jgi:hypothetical protein
MADVHILDGEGGKLKMACHIPIPSTNNSANVNWRSALIRSRIGGATVMVDGDGTGGTISAAEKTSIQNGELFEEVIEILPDTAGSSGAAQLAYVDARYNATVTRVLASLQDRLKYFGLNREVP